ncbi:G-PROTEIN-RECEP-F1-2 domain-containing protein [Aphelenchoides bicaudatus]|nr:G-PROTEIN-RECEP-F1-2 domain-containing protein [Aphelenchoides bicaudatus]
MRTATNFFLGNLAFADLLVAIFCILQNMFHIVGSQGGSWIFGEIVCKLYVLILNLVPCAVIGILVCVSFEKYIAVLHPLLALKVLTPTLRGVMMLGIWFTATVVNLPYFFATKETVFEDLRYCSRNFDSFISVKAVVTTSFATWYFIPLVTMAFLYSRIGMTLEVRYSNGMNLFAQFKTTSEILIALLVDSANPTINIEVEALNGNASVSRHTSSDEHGNPHTMQSDVIEARKKVIRLLVAIVGVFAVFTLPYYLRMLYNGWADNQMCLNGIEVLAQPISCLLLFMSMAINPLLYAFMSNRFRNATRELLNCRSGSRKFTRTRTICSEVPDPTPVSRSPSLPMRNSLYQRT